MINPRLNILIAYQVLGLCAIVALWCVYALATGRDLRAILPSWLPWQAIAAVFIGGIVMTLITLYFSRPAALTAEYAFDTVGNIAGVDSDRMAVRFGILVRNRTTDRFITTKQKRL